MQGAALDLEALAHRISQVQFLVSEAARHPNVDVKQWYLHKIADALGMHPLPDPPGDISPVSPPWEGQKHD